MRQQIPVGRRGRAALTATGSTAPGPRRPLGTGSPTGSRPGARHPRDWRCPGRAAPRSGAVNASPVVLPQGNAPSERVEFETAAPASRSSSVGRSQGKVLDLGRSLIRPGLTPWGECKGAPAR